ncbi:MAG TPA: substrate-binding domain-containing protein [Actinocrinis sp.]|nr:substrate-binding domain-containing protein [Actinocrinis sp.]
MVVLATCVALAGTAVSSASAVAAVPISGAGSTSAENAIITWSANAASLGLRVSYAGTGSSDGRNQFKNGTVDFAVSDLPYGLTDNGVTDTPPSRPFSYLPIVAGPVAFAYHLTVNGQRLTGLRLSGTTLAKIFTQAVTVWNDPAIQADNPGLTLPATAITPVVRADGSATTETFTHWMATEQPSLWNAYCAAAGRATPCAATSFYPGVPGTNMISVALSSGVAGYVAQPQNEGSITYVESTYAQAAALPVAKVLNAAGYYTAPSAGAVSVSLLTAQLDSSLTANLDGAFTDTDPRAYPLPQVSYLIVPTSTAAPFTVDKGATLGAFASYALCGGANEAQLLGYTPLPQNIVQADLNAIPRIPGAGAPTVGAATCAALATTLIANTPQPQPCDQLGAVVCGSSQLPTESIDTTLPPGSLVISVDANPQVVLPSPVLDPSGALLRTSGSLSPLTVTDNRAGDPGWSVSAQAGDFSDGMGHSIAGLNLGWTPSVIDATAAQTVTVGSPVAPGNGGGLSTARTWATATGLGTTHLGADVQLDVPTSTLAGTYTATLTVTAI